jgi:hypothetical protein
METTVPHPDRRVEDAKASLMARVEELARRFKDARDKFDVRAHIETHPLVPATESFLEH